MVAKLLPYMSIIVPSLYTILNPWMFLSRWLVLSIGVSSKLSTNSRDLEATIMWAAMGLCIKRFKLTTDLDLSRASHTSTTKATATMNDKTEMLARMAFVLISELFTRPNGTLASSSGKKSLRIVAVATAVKTGFRPRIPAISPV